MDLISDEQLQRWKQISARGYLLTPEFVLQVINELLEFRAAVIELTETQIANGGWKLE